MIQLEQLLRCNKEKKGVSKSEGEVLVEFEGWRRMGLPPAEVRPQQLYLYCCVRGSGPGHVAKPGAVCCTGHESRSKDNAEW